MRKSDGMKYIEPKFRRIVIKVGSNVITGNDGTINEWRISQLVQDVAILFKWGIEVILVTSGAVASGRSEVSLSRKISDVSARQVWSAIGQVKLMSIYQYLFGKFGIPAGQVLATKESFRDRTHYLNMKNCISAMFESRVLPVINENDTISVNELMFTDNDELSGLISSMMDSRSLIILSNVDGLFDGAPGCEGSKLIREVKQDSGDLSSFISASKSGFGRGGMATKYSVARKLTTEGIDVFIANGTRDSIIPDIVRGKDVPFTHFKACRKTKNSVRKWLNHSESFARGEVYINSGAKQALLGEKATSLLMIGITGIKGSFRRGDIVRIIDEAGNSVGIGKSQYDSEKASQAIGEKLRKPLIHYDYLVINESVEN